MQLIAVLFFAAMLPVAGWLVDRFGRRPTLLGDQRRHHSLRRIVQSPAGLLITRQPATVLIFLIVGMALTGFAYGPMSAVLPELFPTNVRYTGSGISFNIASILGACGGTVHRDVADRQSRCRICGHLPYGDGRDQPHRSAGDARDQCHLTRYHQSLLTSKSVCGSTYVQLNCVRAAMAFA